MYAKILKRGAVFCLVLLMFLESVTYAAAADVPLLTPSAIVIEASTGQVIFEKNATERRSPASITKIMTLLITFEQLEKGKINLKDEIIISAYAKSMGGSQVYLEEGEV